MRAGDTGSLFPSKKKTPLPKRKPKANLTFNPHAILDTSRMGHLNHYDIRTVNALGDPLFVPPQFRPDKYVEGKKVTKPHSNILIPNWTSRYTNEEEVPVQSYNNSGLSPSFWTNKFIPDPKIDELPFWARKSAMDFDVWEELDKYKKQTTKTKKPVDYGVDPKVLDIILSKFMRS